MSPSAGILQGFRIFDAQMRCGICDEELPGWDAFCDHYDTCPQLPSQPCCRPCLHPQTGDVLVAACATVVAREDLEEHRRRCPIRQACRAARRLVRGAVTQHEMAQKAQEELEAELALVQHAPQYSSQHSRAAPRPAAVHARAPCSALTKGVVPR
jgi:hypothetical protein